MDQDYGMKLLWTLILLFPSFSSARIWWCGSARFGVGNGRQIFNAQSGERNP